MKKRFLCVFLVLIQLFLATGALAEIWYCPKCGNQCTENFCPKDGTPKPASDTATFPIYTIQYARIRSGPASTYPLIATLDEGVTLNAVRRVRSEEGGKDWYMIQYNGMTAYVSCINVSEQSYAPSTQPFNPVKGSRTIVKQNGSDHYSDYSNVKYTLNKKIATRTGPGTNYDEPGTFLAPGDTVTVLSKVADPTNEIYWVQVEFTVGGQKYRAYTGHWRLNNFNPSAVPDEVPIGSCTVSMNLECFYGPGYNYKKIARSVPSGVNCTIYGYVEGSGSDFILIEFYDKNLDCYRRAWVSDPFVDDYTMYYGF